MNAFLPKSFDSDVKPLVHVLTAPNSTQTIGYRFGGFNAGPSLLVAGHDPVATMVYDRLLQLPTLAWMRGSLTLVFLHALERDSMTPRLETLVAPKPDEIAFLPYQMDEAFHEEAAKEGYWTVLRLCASIGMISGRGIPQSKSEF